MERASGRERERKRESGKREKMNTWDSAIGEVMVREGAVSAVVEKVVKWSGVAPAGPDGVAAAGWWA